MAAGRKKLRRIQLGLESTPGTAVTETTRWRGSGVLVDGLEVISIPEEVGILGGLDRTAITKLMGGLELSETGATFEQFQYLVAMGFGGPTTGAADGVGTDKIYTTNIPTTTVPTIKTYTIVGGDDSEQERMEYCHATKITLKGVSGENAKMGGSIAGRQVQRYATGFAAGATIPVVEDAITSRGKVFLDTIGGTYGTTQIANQLLGFEITWTINWIPKFTMDGQLYFSFPMYVDHAIVGKLTMEHDTAAQGNTGLKADWRAQTARKLRIDLIGNNAATGGTTYTQKHLIADMPIKVKKVGGIEDKNGNDIVTVEFESRYNATAGDAGKIIVVNELTTLP